MKAITFAATAAIVAMTSHLAMAQEVTKEEQIAALQEQIKAIKGGDVLDQMRELCSLETVTFSEKAQAACEGDEKVMPRLISDGSRFSSRGVGSEFNTLIANIAVFRGS